jgi:hypothetical protein
VRFDALLRRKVRHVGGVVLVSKIGEVMSELVYEDVRCPHAVGGNGAVEPENPSPAVGISIHQDFDELIRRKLRNLAKRVIVEREYVALAVECVIC